jgi:dTDP-4-dehydrorhamnose reductase
MVQEPDPSVLITGGTGYIGSIFRDYLVRGLSLTRVTATGSADLDVTAEAAVHAALDRLRPDIILHLAAKADTDGCEEDFEGARRVNVDGTLNVVRAGLEAGAFVVHFSSACLYPDNTRPHSESDPLAALCRYTETKLLAEQALKPHHNRILIIRMRQPFSNHRHPRNLLEKLVRYTEFIDEPNSMSHLEECIPISWDVAVRGLTGPLNLTNPGWTTPYRIAELIRKHVMPEKSFAKITYDELLAKVDAVRVNSLVDCSRLAGLGYRLRPVEEAVVDCLTHPVNLGEFTWPSMASLKA